MGIAREGVRSGMRDPHRIEVRDEQHKGVEDRKGTG